MKDLGKTSHLSSTRPTTHQLQLMPVIQLDQEMFDRDDSLPQQSTISTITDENTSLNATNDQMDNNDDIEEIQPLSSTTFTQPRKQKIPLSSNQSQSIDPSNSPPNLLSIRETLQKGKTSLNIKPELLAFI